MLIYWIEKYCIMTPSYITEIANENKVQKYLNLTRIKWKHKQWSQGIFKIPLMLFQNISQHLCF